MSTSPPVARRRDMELWWMRESETPSSAHASGSSSGGPIRKTCGGIWHSRSSRAGRSSFRERRSTASNSLPSCLSLSAGANQPIPKCTYWGATLRRSVPPCSVYPDATHSDV